MNGDNEVIEIRKGDNLIRSSDDGTRVSQVLFIVSQFDLTVDEVTAARSVLEMDEDDYESGDAPEGDSDE